jgi:allene oxide cyclase
MHSRLKFRAAGICTAAGLTAAWFVNPGSAAAAQEITAIEHAMPYTVQDLGADGDSAGDIFAFSNDVFDGDNVNRIGISAGSCVRTVVGVAWECTWTASLAGGQITLQGPYHDSGESVFAVTGGTGSFATAQGDLLVSPIGTDGKQSRFTFRLL